MANVDIPAAGSSADAPEKPATGIHERRIALGLDLTRFEVSGVMLHDIPVRPRRRDLLKGTVPDSEPFLTDQETELDDDFRIYLENKIKIALAEAACPVTFVDGTESVVPPLVAGLLNEEKAAFLAKEQNHDQAVPSTFIPASKEIATALHKKQTAVSPAGVFAVVRGTRRDEPFIALLKVEREQGLRLERGEASGPAVLRAIVERDLVLTQGTKVFKTGFFTGSGNPEDLTGWVSDDQQLRFGGGGRLAADFFMSFLGCRFLDLPQLLTKTFFDETERWIAASVHDPVVHATYARALLAEMTSNKTHVTPKSFAEEHLAVAERQDFLSALNSRDAPVHAFTKDTSLIMKRLREIRMTFESGISVFINPEHFEDGIAKLEQDDETSGVVTLTIRDRIRRIRGA